MPSEKPISANIWKHSKRTFERLNAFLGLPYCAVREAIEKLGLADDAEERKNRARHEAGHALVSVLCGIDVTRAQISRLQSNTCAHLRHLLGNFVAYKMDHVTIDTSAEKKLMETQPEKIVLLSLAGIAATHDSKSDTKALEMSLSEGMEAEWADVSNPYEYVSERFEKIQKRTPTKKEISEIIHLILVNLKNIFSKKHFTQTLQNIQNLILRHQLKEKAQDTILKELEKVGITLDQIEDMQKELFSINIDEIILSYKSH